jgi:hypothetical protein
MLRERIRGGNLGLRDPRSIVQGGATPCFDCSAGKYRCVRHASGRARSLTSLREWGWTERSCSRRPEVVSKLVAGAGFDAYLGVRLG